MLTDAQREAAIKTGAQAVAECRSLYGGRSRVATTDREAACMVIDALRDAGLLLLHKDDVWREYSYHDDAPLDPYSPDQTTHMRLVTRWEPITDPTRKDKNDG